MLRSNAPLPNFSFKPSPLRGLGATSGRLGRAGLIQVLGLQMRDSLSQRFSRFLGSFPHAECIDSMRSQSPKDTKRADYLLHNGKIVVEIKSLNAKQKEKGNEVINEYLADTGIEIYGTLPLSRIAKNADHQKAIEKKIFIRMTRGVEKICQSADAQLASELSRLPGLGTGVLVILNEALTDLDPYMVARRVRDFAQTKRSSIHYCLLVFESHKVLIDGVYRPYPLLVDLAYSARQRRAKPLLHGLLQIWARRNGHSRDLPVQDTDNLEFYPKQLVFGH
jgi:hypothetical protein